MKFILSFVIALSLLFTPSFGISQQFYKGKIATLTWNANSEDDLAGYKIYRSLNYCAKKQPKTIINTVEKVTEFVDNKIPLGTIAVCYYITAFDTAGNESPPSNEVDKPIAVAPGAPKNFVPSTPIIK